MNYFDQRYNSTNYPIIITENGISSRGNGTDLEPEVKILFKWNSQRIVLESLFSSMITGELNFIMDTLVNYTEPLLKMESMLLAIQVRQITEDI